MADRSPFPGMDPWLERHGESIHFTYVQECRRQLVSQLPEGVCAEVEETVYIVDAEGDRGPTVRPDAAVFGHRSGTGDGSLPAKGGDPTGAVAAAPIRIALSSEPAVVIDYARPPEPPLSTTDAAWGAECVAASAR